MAEFFGAAATRNWRIAIGLAGKGMTVLTGRLAKVHDDVRPLGGAEQQRLDGRRRGQEPLVSPDLGRSPGRPR